MTHREIYEWFERNYDEGFKIYGLLWYYTTKAAAIVAKRYGFDSDTAQTKAFITHVVRNTLDTAKEQRL